ncbi:MAG: serine--tRNA ligase, partial [Methylococcales bacterium]|nr:serine--tRNA ligase [Methylococcales bacterium]
MLDSHLFRNKIDFVTTELARRHFTLDVDVYQSLENQRKAIQVTTQKLQNERNVGSKKIGQAKAKGEDIKPLLANIENLGVQLKASEIELNQIQQKIALILEGTPNLLDESVPDGKSEANNIELSRWGNVPEFDFEAKDHVDLGENLKGMSFELGAKIASARFVVLTGKLAQLQRALIQFMLDTHTEEHGYSETYVPFLVNADSLRGTGQLPKFEDDLFKAREDSALYLIPTAEVPVTNMVRDTIIDAETLPLKYTCHSPCFRSEAGAYGRDVRGMIRQHQFE